MNHSRRMRAALGITLSVAAFWTTAAVLVGLALGSVVGGIPMPELVSWLLESVPTYLGVGLCLGAAYAAGLVVLGPGRKRATLTGGRSSLVGLLGGAAAFALTAPFLGLPTVSPLWHMLVVPVLSFMIAGGATGFAVWSVANRAERPAIGGTSRVLEPSGPVASAAPVRGPTA